MALAAEICKPCRRGEGKLTSAEAMLLLGELEDWTFYPDHLEKRWEFKNFRLAQGFVNQIAAVAEIAGHHPDISFGWGYVELRLATHSAGGLTRNDFVLAAKIDEATVTG